MNTVTPICSTCGSDFECLNGRQPDRYDAHGWYDCTHRCAICSQSLTDGRAVMEHPGLAALIHLQCCPVPAEPEDEELLFVIRT